MAITIHTHVVFRIALSPPHAHVADALEVFVEEVDQRILGDGARESRDEQRATLDVPQPLLGVCWQGVSIKAESAH